MALAGWFLLRHLLSFGISRSRRSRASARSLIQDPRVVEAAKKHARERVISVEEAMSLAERYAREIIPSFNPYLYFRLAIPLARWVYQPLYEVRVVSAEGLEALNSRDASVVFMMNHRSNLDYVILAHLVAGKRPLSFAAGEWARVWPLGPLVRAQGSFFVRRGSGDDLYRRVLESFVHMAVEDGLTQAVFPEGGLSRDGKPQDPKIGLLDYMLRSFDADGKRDLVFVPVAINYDWVLEDYSLLQTGGPEAGWRGRGGLFASAASSYVRNLRDAPRGVRPRLGGAAVSFGAPISTRRYMRSTGVDFLTLDREARIEQVKILARFIMHSIGESTPFVSVPIVSRVLLEASDESLSKSEIYARVRNLSSEFEERDIGVGPVDPKAALQILSRRRLIRMEDGRYRILPESEKLLGYYANSISHL